MKAPFITRVTLYNLKTGEAHSFHPVDARECLARGGWSEQPPRKMKKVSSGNAASGPSVTPEPPTPEGRRKSLAPSYSAPNGLFHLLAVGGVSKCAANGNLPC